MNGVSKLGRLGKLGMLSGTAEIAVRATDVGLEEAEVASKASWKRNAPVTCRKSRIIRSSP